MRAKIISVVFVVFGLLGAVAVSASAADRAQVAGDHATLSSSGAEAVGAQPANREDDGDKGEDEGHHDEGDGDSDGEGCLLLCDVNLDDVLDILS